MCIQCLTIALLGLWYSGSCFFVKEWDTVTWVEPVTMTVCAVLRHPPEAAHLPYIAKVLVSDLVC